MSSAASEAASHHIFFSRHLLLHVLPVLPPPRIRALRKLRSVVSGPHRLLPHVVRYPPCFPFARGPDPPWLNRILPSNCHLRFSSSPLTWLRLSPRHPTIGRMGSTFPTGSSSRDSRRSSSGMAASRTGQRRIPFGPRLCASSTRASTTLSACLKTSTHTACSATPTSSATSLASKARSLATASTRLSSSLPLSAGGDGSACAGQTLEPCRAKLALVCAVLFCGRLLPLSLCGPMSMNIV